WQGWSAPVGGGQNPAANRGNKSAIKPVNVGNPMLKTIAASDRIGEKNAFAVLARANALAAQGKDIINLGIGQPDFRTPEFIVEAAIQGLRDGHHGYTPPRGIPQLREAVAADLAKRF